VFERFTERARQAVVLAQDEARALNHNYIGTEHLLLGLLREEEGLAARVLESLEITVEEVRAEVARIIGEGDEVATGQIPFTPRAKKVLELALREALSIGHNYIGTEHILLGIAREGEGVAMRILLDFDADAEKIRTRIIEMLSGASRPEKVPLHPDLQAEVDRVSRAKREAIESQQFDRAAALRDRERTLFRLAQSGDLDQFWEEARRPLPRRMVWGGLRQTASFLTEPVFERRPARGGWTLPFVAGGLTFGVALGLGILIGWLVWG
jgi:ATP-dependent Clp protease ATP-binding subunit ClpC